MRLFVLLGLKYFAALAVVAALGYVVVFVFGFLVALLHGMYHDFFDPDWDC